MSAAPEPTAPLLHPDRHPVPCPSWCESSGEESHAAWGTDHTLEVGVLAASHSEPVINGDHYAQPAVRVYLEQENGERPPNVNLNVNEPVPSTTSPGLAEGRWTNANLSRREARELAALLVRAVDLLDGEVAR